MKYTPARVVELLRSMPWPSSSSIRILWVCVAGVGRQAFVDSLPNEDGEAALVPVIIRESLFQNANSVLSDVQRLFAQNRTTIVERAKGKERMTVLLLAQDAFRFPQISSPITLPEWFPIRPGLECGFSICDLGETAQVSLLNCPEARIDLLASQSFELESNLVSLLSKRASISAADADRFVRAINGNFGCLSALLSQFESHLRSVADSRAYRPNASQKSNSLLSKLLRLVLNSNPKDLSHHGKRFAKDFGDTSVNRLKPSILGVMLRPAESMTASEANWHAILIGAYQSYQCMNGAAHAGDYPAYPVGLIYSHSMDLARFLSESNMYLTELLSRT